MSCICDKDPRLMVNWQVSPPGPHINIPAWVSCMSWCNLTVSSGGERSGSAGRGWRPGGS